MLHNIFVRLIPQCIKISCNVRVPTQSGNREKEGNMNDSIPGREKGGKFISKLGKMCLGREKMRK
jgi:hypothetical protein